MEVKERGREGGESTPKGPQDYTKRQRYIPAAYRAPPPPSTPSTSSTPLTTTSVSPLKAMCERVLLSLPLRRFIPMLAQLPASLAQRILKQLGGEVVSVATLRQLEALNHSFVTEEAFEEAWEASCRDDFPLQEKRGSWRDTFGFAFAQRQAKLKSFGERAMRRQEEARKAKETCGVQGMGEKGTVQMQQAMSKGKSCRVKKDGGTVFTRIPKSRKGSKRPSSAFSTNKILQRFKKQALSHSRLLTIPKQRPNR